MTEVVTAETATDKVLPLDRRLRAAKGALILAEHKRREWWHDAGPNVTQDHIRHPDYWAMLAPQLIRHDLITVLSVDQSWEALLCVERVRQDGADVSVRKIASRTTIVSAGQVVDGIGDYVSEWRAGDGWCVIRVKDGVPIVKGHGLEATAIADWRAKQPRKVA